jgi:hypothetical protein
VLRERARVIGVVLRKYSVTLAVCWVAVFCSLLTVVSCGSRPTHEKWIVPRNYIGWVRLDYGVVGATPLPMENGNYLIRIPGGGRLVTSSSDNGSKMNEYFVATTRGFQRLEVSHDLIREYAVQNAYSFGKIVPSHIPYIEAQCVFVGTDLDFKANSQNCEAWKAGQPEPPKFEKHPPPHLREGQAEPRASRLTVAKPLGR